MDELRNVQLDTELIPEGCLSFVEEATYIATAIDEDFDAMVGDEDNGEESTNESVILESNDFADKIVIWAQKVWGQIKKLFNDLINWINERVTEFKNKQLEKKLANVISQKKLKSDAKLGKYHESSSIGDVAWMDVLTPESLFKIDTDQGDATELLPKKVSDAVGGKRGKSATVAEMKEDMKTYFLGKEVEVTGANFNKETFVKILKGSQKNDVKKAYNKCRAQINGYIKKIKGWKATGEKTKAGDDIYVKANENKSGKLKNTLNYLRRCLQLLSTGVGVQCDCIRTQNREAMSIVAAASRKANKKDQLKESANIFAW